MKSIRYTSRVRGRLFALALLAGLVLASAGSAQVRTTAPNVYVNVNVTLTDSRVIVSPRSAPRGADARIVVRNIGKSARPFAFGYNSLGSGVHTGFNRVFQPGRRSVLFLFLDSRGVISYYSGPSFARASSAAKGTFIVGTECALCNQD